MTSRSFARYAAFCLATSAVTMLPLRAQESTPADTTRREVVKDAFADGRRAADQRSVGGRALTAGLIGVPVGFFGSALLLAGPQPELVGLAALGGGALVLARRPGNTAPPDSLAAVAAREGSDYEQAWRAGYRERLGERRRKASDVGGTVGAIIGAALILSILLDPDYT